MTSLPRNTPLDDFSRPVCRRRLFHSRPHRMRILASTPPNHRPATRAPAFQNCASGDPSASSVAVIRGSAFLDAARCVALRFIEYNARPSIGGRWTGGCLMPTLFAAHHHLVAAHACMHAGILLLFPFSLSPTPSHSLTRALSLLGCFEAPPFFSFVSCLRLRILESSTTILFCYHTTRRVCSKQIVCAKVWTSFSIPTIIFLHIPWLRPAAAPPAQTHTHPPPAVAKRTGSYYPYINDKVSNKGGLCFWTRGSPSAAFT